MGQPKTSITSHGTIASSPTETYGSGPVILRIGNGGAGATGLIRALAEDYLSTLPPSETGSITWVCNHSRNTQLALLHNYVDIALTYERSTEAIAENEGWSRTFGCVFHDHFVLAGPLGDPAGIQERGSLAEAFRRVWEVAGKGEDGVTWHARNDESATMWKERGFWGATAGDLKPWDDERARAWYQMSVCSPAEAIQKADAAGAYLLTDRSTLLRQTVLGTIENTTVFFEPGDGEDVLMNSCYALFAPDEIREPKSHLSAFLDYMVGERGQKVIENFGVEEVGVPLFAGLKEGFSRRRLKGGGPRDGKWVEK